jgi:flagellum-specific ATP synthase
MGREQAAPFLMALSAATALRAEIAASGLTPVSRSGFVVRCAGEIMWSTSLGVPTGARCMIEAAYKPLGAEVVGFDDGMTMLMAERGNKGVRLGDRVTATHGVVAAAVGDALLGRVLDAYGDSLDGGPPPGTEEHWPLTGKPLNPMARVRITRPFDIGIRTINGLATLGRGMRVGLFAGSGVGKSTLLGMAARHAEVDCVVVAMIGERGREIREFVEDHLGDMLSRSVVVASAADSPPLARLHGAQRAAAIAEYFRACGRHVLFLVDSLTRLAMAGREIGLSVGEPPTTKGYPPSVFGQLAAYVERAGNGSDAQGSITAIYTVLVEADDHIGDPVADAARSVLDGHIVLSRRSSESGIYPPIDPASSLSRPMPGLVSEAHNAAAVRFRLLWARLEQKRELVDIGAYAPGRDSVLDDALARSARMEAFLRQGRHDKVPLEPSAAALRRAVEDM